MIKPTAIEVLTGEVEELARNQIMKIKLIDEDGNLQKDIYLDTRFSRYIVPWADDPYDQTVWDSSNEDRYHSRKLPMVNDLMCITMRSGYLEQFRILSISEHECCNISHRETLKLLIEHDYELNDIIDFFEYHKSWWINRPKESKIEKVYNAYQTYLDELYNFNIHTDEE